MAPEALEERQLRFNHKASFSRRGCQVAAGRLKSFGNAAGAQQNRPVLNAPCLVKKVEDRAAIAMALIENIQREDLNVIEEAQALERLQDEFTLTHQQVADVIGKSRTVSNLLRLNQWKLMPGWLDKNKWSCRALLALGEQQVEVAQQVAKKQMTVRQTEQLVKKCLAPQNEQKAQQEDIEAEQMSHKLSQLLDAKVSLVRSANGKAKVTISLDEPHKLDQLIAKLEA